MALGEMLRVWRDRLSPLDAGLPAGGRRRAAGLRREELAMLAGISADYLERLERGRATAPSAQVLGALARALQLSRDERDHLYRLGGQLPPAGARVPEHVPPGVHRLVHRLGDLPIAVFTADWRLLLWTRLWAALLGDPVVTPGHSLVEVIFPEEGGELPAAVDAGGLLALERALVADLRAAAAAYPEDPDLAARIARKKAGSARFAKLWAAGEVGVYDGERKTIRHPVAGPITVDCDLLTVRGADLRVITYTAPAGSPDAEKLEFLRVLDGSPTPPRPSGPGRR